jgi:hypothetical protein
MRSVRRNVIDAGWFIVIAALVRIAGDLHASGKLPHFIECW